MVERNRFGKFVRGHYKEHFCEIILNFDRWFQGIMSF